MLYIHLHDLRFRSYHGLYKEEQVLGNDYVLNLVVGFTPRRLPVEQLEESLDYVSLYRLVKQRMDIPTTLLESVITGIAAQIQQEYPSVEKISIALKKLYPPVNNFEGAVGVSFEWNK